jgi:hypothetical protein
MVDDLPGDLARQGTPPREILNRTRFPDFSTTDLVSAFSPVKLPGSEGSFIGMQVALTRCLAFRQNCVSVRRIALLTAVV